MSARARYLRGLAAVAGLATVAIVLAGPDIRLELAAGTGLGLLLQAPLGWITVRSVDTPRFQLVWLLGMAIRLGVVAITGLVLVPALGWQMVPALGGLVATMLLMLLVEVLTVMRENSGITAR